LVFRYGFWELDVRRIGSGGRHHRGGSRRIPKEVGNTSTAVLLTVSGNEDGARRGAGTQQISAHGGEPQSHFGHDLRWNHRSVWLALERDSGRNVTRGEK